MILLVLETKLITNRLRHNEMLMHMTHSHWEVPGDMRDLNSSLERLPLQPNAEEL